MEGKKNGAQSIARRLVRELWGTLLPAVLALGLFVLLPKDSRSQVETSPPRPGQEAAPLCGEWHRGAGESVPLDLARVKAAYASLKNRLTRALSERDLETAVDLAKPYDTGLPACREDDVRTEPLPVEKGARFRGQALYFVSLPERGSLTLPPLVESDKATQILVLRARSLGDLPGLSKELGRPVHLATREFAKALGVRCANTWLKISEKGDAVEIHESH